jgi:hypothetical protein
MKDKKHEAWLMESRLMRKYGVSMLRVGVEDKGGYFCSVSERSSDQYISGLKREVAEYSAKKLGMYFCPIDMSHPGDDPYSEVIWVWGKDEKFEDLDGIEDFVNNFAGGDLEKVEKLYDETLGRVAEKLREESEKKPPPKSRIEILLGE